MKHLSPHALKARRSFLTTAFAVLGSLGLATCAVSASAHARLATLEVFDRDTGRLLPSYSMAGQQFVPGRPGARYALRVRNLTAERVMVVLSVDGVNVVTGQTANWNQSGYVLDPGASYDVNGWRKSNTEVAGFEFAALENSYAARTGRPDNVGTLGMAVFRERPVVPVTPPANLLPSPQRLGRSDAATPAASGAPQDAAKSKSLAEGRLSEKLGTAHGAREWSVVRETEFTRLNSTPDNLVEINYDSYDRLVAAGVIQRPYANHRAQPFPANTTGFVADPPTN